VPVLGTADYPQVRALLGTEVTEAVLPASVIGMDVYQGVAESWANARIEDATALVPADAESLHRAAIIYLAGLLAPILPDYTMRRDGGIQGTEEQMRPVDRYKQQEYLLSQAEAILQDILDLLPVVPGPMPSQFMTAGPVRRRW
jgi:hypothetical protein